MRCFGLQVSLDWAVKVFLYRGPWRASSRLDKVTVAHIGNSVDA